MNSYWYNNHCPYCGNKAIVTSVGLDTTMIDYWQNFSYKISRTYLCTVCQAVINITTVESNPSVEKALERDLVWEENQKSDQSS